MRCGCFIALVLIYFHLSSCQDTFRDFLEINCETTAEDKNICSPNEECRVKCPLGCINNYKPISGTVNYTQNSTICKAALHDLRISYWDSSKCNVTFRLADDICMYHGSTSYGVKSNRIDKCLSNLTSFYFTSGRVVESTYDISTLYKLNRVKEVEDTVLECHGRTNALDKKLIFHMFVETAKGSHPNKFSHTRQVIEDNRSRIEMVIDKDEGRKQFGAFYCAVENFTFSRVVAVISPPDAKFVPDFYTVTANVGESVSLNVTRKGSDQRPEGWSKDNNPNFLFKKKIRRPLIIEETELGHTGVYSIFVYSHKTFTDQDTRGMIRLIVRSCPKDVYGPLCEFLCPKCQNGGICHDITGECLCAPGFKGLFCEKACGPNSFGRECDAHCTWPDATDGCKWKLICIPDPYGCSCASGFKGSDCGTECDVGEYGAGCLQHRHCHCSNGNSCDRFTGLCPGGCEPGWKGQSCEDVIPVPRVWRILCDQATVQWLPWYTNKENKGPENFSTYIVQYQEFDSYNWISNREILSNSSMEQINETIVGLEADMTYNLRVARRYMDGYLKYEETLLSNFTTMSTCEVLDYIVHPREINRSHLQVFDSYLILYFCAFYSAIIRT